MAKGKYHDWITREGLIKIEGWARDGLTNKQISQNIGISEETLYKWIVKYTELSESLKRGKEVVDREVENALLKRALGYEYIETTKEGIGGQLKVTKEVTKQVAPDVTAQIFWLKNRKPEEWREKKEVQHMGEINNPYATMTMEQLLKLTDLEEE
ncbi:transposase [Metaclostridioides mangenotii]|uniref:transposase n=1 Tax=Metaclostridioides mangenotii TaxID=1540 RepID=UPI000485504C|nr:transposase [Clostridioides mangenotii]